MSRALRIIVLLAGSIACAESNGPTLAGTQFLGPIAGTDLALAVVVGDRAMVAYLCGGPSTFETHSQWFESPFDPLAPTPLLLETADFQLDLELDAARAAGTVKDPAGAAVAVDLPNAATGSVLGLYEARPRGCRTGAIVMPAEDGPRLQGTFCSDTGLFDQVEPVLPIERKEQGIEVRIDVSGQLESFFVLPVPEST